MIRIGLSVAWKMPVFKSDSGESRLAILCGVTITRDPPSFFPAVPYF
jgi:hypothetical protein